MKVVYEILLDTALYLSFILVVGAFCYSAMILFKPKAALHLNGRFNSWFSTEKIDGAMDTHIDTNDLIARNRWWVGSLFLAGALLTLKYLLLDFEADKFISLVVQPSGKTAQTFSEIAVVSIQWLLVFTSFLGAAACGFFLVSPEAFQRLSNKMDTQYSTEALKESADTVYTALDNWVMKNHVLVGLFLLLGSTYLVIFLLMTLM
ncbi:MAG: hypothetical protein HOI59_14135 [Nitrospina sp.]|jgi:hypothetical protein|nr:hypothetical protein [Nitrospina sp.]MBT3414602.1 hypothetical protein [Nitrospina sp.]MBT3855397.1 hypothetical protein [Nitrospina sp.]MBT4106057.1 hypothetical protein [Nitrospina sp.]MBT4388473.1 hypothetical protein [Nitrospina sp.]